ncbi:zinc finger protein 665-like [Xyrichtys novacula]|uniref:Zinc finger protein 665-like n=1 Tax=Xyrichtys novacula TaxID=13765 RepID=A0AAV1EZH1_XYRNO|nr:zinc finger protein 665-like [Xyrichtys novacula]
MDEVTVEVDEEVTKQDFSFEPLPEPLLIILSPPPPFLPVPRRPAMLWHKWLKAFEHYVEGLNEHELSDTSKCLLLQNCLGPEGQRIFSILNPSETSYAAAISTLSLYFSSSQSSQMYRLKFHQRGQEPGETVFDFVCELKELLRSCNYGGPQEKLVLDQLIEKTNCTQLKSRLMLERGRLTLDKALVIAKEVESALGDGELFGVHEVSVDISDDFDPPVIKRKRGRPRKDEKREKTVIKPRPAEKPARASKIKDNFYYSDDKMYYSENEEGDKTTQTGDKSSSETAADEDSALSASQRTEEEVSDKASDDVICDDDDEDEDLGSSPSFQKGLKGPFCPLCVNRRFRDAHKLARHMRTHTKEKPFSCPICSVTFSQSYHMTRHMRNQHGAGPHVCSTCGESLGSHSELQSHKRAHEPRVLSCPACYQNFTREGAFLTHLMSHSKDQCEETEGRSSQEGEEVKNSESSQSCDVDDHESDECSNDVTEVDADSGKDDSQEIGSEVTVKTEVGDADEADGGDGDAPKEKVPSKTRTKDHVCPICVDRRFRGQNKLARHMRTHTKEKPFSCPVCSLTFSQSYHMTRHLRNQHDLGQYICTKCGKSLGSWLELKEHRKTHAVEGLTCLACDKQFKEKAELVRHLKVHKKVTNPRSLICGDCGKVFGRMYHLKRHLMSHRKAANVESYTCPDCQKTFAFPEDLNKHLEVHVKENNGTCPKCNRKFSSPEELEAHMGEHEKTYPCNTCGKKFKVEYALKKHEQSHQDEQYYCSLCRKHFTKLSHYKRHIMVHDRRECRCPHCDSVFLQLTAFKYHLRTHTEERPYQCTCCIESFEDKEDLDQHCLKHRKFKKERPYSCTRCDCAFSMLIELTEHMTSHEGEQPMNCPICGKTFLNKNKLEKHLSIHTGERPHLCSICGDGFPSAASLKLHIHIHTGEKPFQCSQCSKSFRSSSGLRLHSKQHLDIRPSYECPECGRTYGRMTELKMHQRYHTGDKPYACTCCSKRFISKDKLNVHMRVHTGERPYSCPHCGQTFTQTGDRNRHISKYH